ncbi:MAG: hypothetical protein ACXABY_23235 [Candidatus Thorarchaeota archaeon]|jgi:hypothetical protein
MILDSEAQRTMLLQMIVGATIEVKVIGSVVNLLDAVKRAEIASTPKQEDNPKESSK